MGGSDETTGEAMGATEGHAGRGVPDSGDAAVVMFAEILRANTDELRESRAFREKTIETISTLKAQAEAAAKSAEAAATRAAEYDDRLRKVETFKVDRIDCRGQHGGLRGTAQWAVMAAIALGSLIVASIALYSRPASGQEVNVDGNVDPGTLAVLFGALLSKAALAVGNAAGLLAYMLTELVAKPLAPAWIKADGKRPLAVAILLSIGLGALLSLVPAFEVPVYAGAIAGLVGILPIAAARAGGKALRGDSKDGTPKADEGKRPRPPAAGLGVGTLAALALVGLVACSGLTQVQRAAMPQAGISCGTLIVSKGGECLGTCYAAPDVLDCSLACTGRQIKATTPACSEAFASALAGDSVGAELRAVIESGIRLFDAINRATGGTIPETTPATPATAPSAPSGAGDGRGQGGEAGTAL